MAITTEYTTNQMAQIIVIQMRQGGWDIPSDVVDQFVTYINEAQRLMQEVAGYDPANYATDMAKLAYRRFCEWQYSSMGPSRPGNLDDRYEIKWNQARIAWGRAAAKEYHLEQAYDLT